jgi:hypothetical protein
MRQIFAGKTGFTLETYAFPSFCQNVICRIQKVHQKEALYYFGTSTKKQ